MPSKSFTGSEFLYTYKIITQLLFLTESRNDREFIYFSWEKKEKMEAQRDLVTSPRSFLWKPYSWFSAPLPGLRHFWAAQEAA